MSAPLGFFITWTTHGTWLPGDARGWVRSGEPGIQSGDLQKEAQARRQLRERPIVLTPEQRLIMERTIRDHCEHRKWELRAANARANHIHAVVTADADPDEVMN